MKEQHLRNKNFPPGTKPSAITVALTVIQLSRVQTRSRTDHGRDDLVNCSTVIRHWNTYSTWQTREYFYDNDVPLCNTSCVTQCCECVCLRSLSTRLQVCFLFTAGQFACKMAAAVLRLPSVTLRPCHLPHPSQRVVCVCVFAQRNTNSPGCHPKRHSGKMCRHLEVILHVWMCVCKWVSANTFWSCSTREHFPRITFPRTWKFESVMICKCVCVCVCEERIISWAMCVIWLPRCSPHTHTHTWCNSLSLSSISLHVQFSTYFHTFSPHAILTSCECTRSTMHVCDRMYVVTVTCNT